MKFETVSLWTTLPPARDWSPAEPPRIASAGIKKIRLDLETTGLSPWTGDTVVGTAVGWDEGGRSCARYLPTGHRGGGNLDESAVRRWYHDELRGVEITNLNVKFDIHMAREWGVDLESQGCTLREVQHAAALLDGDRRSSTLESLAQDYLGRGKVDTGIPAADISKCHASQIDAYACSDVLLARDLQKKMDPMINAEGLRDVLDLEDSIIWCVAAMERNGAPIDVEKMERWRVEAADHERRLQKQLDGMAGTQVLVDSAPHIGRLFRTLGLDAPGVTEKGSPSFTAELLRSVDHPVAGIIRGLRGVKRLRSFYLDKYPARVDHGVLRYSLHQLRGDWGESGAMKGTVTGRFSSSNINIQQVYKPSRQAEQTGISSWLIRELFVPEQGRVWFSTDASQIEFRIFAHLSRNTELIAEYVNGDPDFHSYVAGLTGQNRRDAKNITFCKLFGGGVAKVASMVGCSTDKAYTIVDQYDRRFPDAARLLKSASSAAERRGYVRTLLGRKRRYKKVDRHYSALNSVIQGTAADEMKIVLKRLYDSRKELGLTLRLAKHDEVCGDLDDPGKASDLTDLMDEPSDLGLNVPIKWVTRTGRHWAEC